MTGFDRLLVPHDLSPHADRALAVAADLAGPDGELLVLHVVTPPIVPATEVFSPVSIPIERLSGEARRHLERTVARVVGKRGPKITVEVVAGSPHQRIVEHARGRDAIVMSTLGRTGLAHLVMGSVAEKTVRHSPIPVLTLPARTRRRARFSATAARATAADSADDRPRLGFAPARGASRNRLRARAAAGADGSLSPKPTRATR
jgi:nucleotide-binding universal stress UspA family protein